MNYRIVVRGKQTYLMPKVGTSWSKLERQEIKERLVFKGYFVSVISEGRIAVSETSYGPTINDVECYL